MGHPMGNGIILDTNTVYSLLIQTLAGKDI